MKRLYIFLILFSAFCVLPSAVQAEGCTCFCSSTEGAYQYSEDDVADVATCQEACDDYLGCYADNPVTDDEDESLTLQPKYDTMCWTKYACEGSEEEDAMGEWAGQHSNCINEQGLCYSEAIPVTLNVAIGSLTEATSLGEYINAGYSFALAGGSMLAIVMMMLGGLQYMLARGKPEAIGKAKTRIKNAITGIVLLFASYTIANLVDPSFTTFNRISPPKIRVAFFLDPDSTCEAMQKGQVTIIPATGSCGDVGVVLDPGPSAAGITVGDECIYSGCSDPYAKCNGNAQEESGYRCERCYQLARTAEAFSGGEYALADSESLNISLINPSESACSKMVPEDLYPDDDLHYYCLFNDDYYSECAEISYPEGEVGVDCDRLRQDADAANSEGCRAYDLLTVGSFDVEFLSDGLDYYDIDEFTGDDDEYELLEKFCMEDVCKLAPSGDSCSVAVKTAEELTYDIWPDLLEFMVGDVLVNCTNTSAIDSFGIGGCLDKNGDEADCNPTW